MTFNTLGVDALVTITDRQLWDGVASPMLNWFWIQNHHSLRRVANQGWRIQSAHSWGEKRWIHTFPKSNCAKPDVTNSTGIQTPLLTVTPPAYDKCFISGGKFRFVSGKTNFFLMQLDMYWTTCLFEAFFVLHWKLFENKCLILFVWCIFVF